MPNEQYQSIVADALCNVGEAIHAEHPDFATSIYVVANVDGTISVCDNGEEVVCKTTVEAVRIIVENIEEYERK